MIKRVVLMFLTVVYLVSPVSVQARDSDGWLPWSKDIFKRAQAENRFVILDLEAVWCHWCHVMEQTTYADPQVKKLLAQKYLPVRVDQDENLELSNRYGDWGWPATIVFAPDGTEIVKLRGYIPPVRMISLLQAIIDDPSPGPSVIKDIQPTISDKSFLSKEQRKHLLGNYNGVYDSKNGGWGEIHKFIHTESMDYAMAQAMNGDKKFTKQAKQTLDAALNLFDPVWGGVYQYSDKVDWKSPHYEKIMSYQAQYMRHYIQAYSLWGDQKYLDAAKNIYGYLTTLMKNEKGAFYTSQDADLNTEVDGKKFYALNAEERKKLGMPRIDKNIYARENGWVITGLVALYNVTSDPKILAQAETAMNWVIQARQLKGGGFKHGDADKGGPYLGDNLAVGQAALDLYGATGNRKWLKLAANTGTFIGRTFKNKAGGYITSAVSSSNVGVFAKPVVQIEENIQLARFLNALNRYHGSKDFRDQAEHVMRYLVAEEVTKMRRFLIGVVLADDELSIEPAHITIVGKKNDPAAQALHKAARELPIAYKRIDWWDKAEGPMINPDVKYPELEKAAAFACSNNVCSLPVFNPENLNTQVTKMMSVRVPVKRASANK